MTVDPHETTIVTCDRGHVFEDLAVAVAENGGWCPTCDGPARSAPSWPFDSTSRARCVEELAERRRLLDYEIEEEFAEIRRAVRREFAKIRAWVRLRVAIEREQVAFPVNVGDDGRWGETTPTSERTG